MVCVWGGGGGHSGWGLGPTGAAWPARAHAHAMQRTLHVGPDSRRRAADADDRDADKHGLPDKQTPALFDWFARAHTYDRTAAGAGAAVSRLQSPVPACHFWVDHKYRIIYVRGAVLRALCRARAPAVPCAPLLHRRRRRGTLVHACDGSLPPPTRPQVRNTKTAGTSVAETLGMKNIPMACR